MTTVSDLKTNSAQLAAGATASDAMIMPNFAINKEGYTSLGGVKNAAQNVANPEKYFEVMQGLIPQFDKFKKEPAKTAEKSHIKFVPSRDRD